MGSRLKEAVFVASHSEQRAAGVYSHARTRLAQILFEVEASKESRSFFFLNSRERQIFKSASCSLALPKDKRPNSALGPGRAFCMMEIATMLQCCCSALL
jgi:hypothetical protein